MLPAKNPAAQPLYNIGPIVSGDNFITDYWTPGSVHTLGAKGYNEQRGWLFMWITIICIEYICEEYTSLYLMLQTSKT